MLEGISPAQVANSYSSQGLPGTDNLRTLQLIQQFQAVSAVQGREKAKEEFLAVFYKELLKQAFNPPKFSIGETDTSFAQTFTSDLMVEKLALELAKSGSFSPDEIFPAEIDK